MIMALQVCIRCRKRRIKCDLQLPACKNCRVADVECLFWEDSLGQEIPCSYLHSLQQKVQALQTEIQYAKDSGCVPVAISGDSAESAHIHKKDYHLDIFDRDAISSPSRIAYIGPGSSARLLERLLKDSVQWHIARNVQIPKRLVPDDPSPLIGLPGSEASASFPITYNTRKVELHSLVPPSTQRAIIEHYLKTVSPEYTILPAEQESALLSYENPLKWSGSNKDNLGSFTISIVFAISTTLVTRDLDPNLSGISVRCGEDVQKLSEKSFEDPIETTRWTCIALCALALCELISPISGQLWDILGRATSAMEQLREIYHLRCLNLDEYFYRLERSLLKLESSASFHLRRPSTFCKLRFQNQFEDISMFDALSDELRIMSHLHKIVDAFTKSPRPQEIYFESMIPSSMRVDPVTADISIYSAFLYVALHPIFTTTDNHADGTLSDPSSRIFHVIARSACIIIDNFTRLNESNKIISIWLAAERVLEAGTVWATYLLKQRQASPTGEQLFASMGTRISMGPIVKVSTLLASFAARWKGGLAYVDAWDTFVELLWNML